MGVGEVYTGLNFKCPTVDRTTFLRSVTGYDRLLGGTVDERNKNAEINIYYFLFYVHAYTRITHARIF